METVRKGKALKDPEKWAEYEDLMRENNVPEWYIDSCKKIKYMFPKAHAAAYVMMAFRIAWFKVHIPMAYYAAYFSIRAKAFDAEFMIFGKEKVKEKMQEINKQGNEAAPKDKDMYDDLEIVFDSDAEYNNVEVYISFLRKKLKLLKTKVKIKAVRGIGYKLEVEND